MHTLRKLASIAPTKSDCRHWLMNYQFDISWAGHQSSFSHHMPATNYSNRNDWEISFYSQ